MISKRPIGQLKIKATVHCGTCGSSLRRNLKEFVYENTPVAIEKTKDILKVKAAKPYTCRRCKCIKKDLI